MDEKEEMKHLHAFGRHLERRQNAIRLAQARLDEVDRDLAAATRKVVRLTEERHEAEERLRAAKEGARCDR